MEIYSNSPQSQKLFKDAINQNGNGFTMDRYVYGRNMEGAGIGSFFGKIFKMIMPVAKKGINTAYKIAKPHLQNFGEDVLSSAQQEATRRITEATRKIKGKRKSDYLDDEQIRSKPRSN